MSVVASRRYMRRLARNMAVDWHRSVPGRAFFCRRDFWEEWKKVKIVGARVPHGNPFCRLQQRGQREMAWSVAPPASANAAPRNSSNLRTRTSLPPVGLSATLTLERMMKGRPRVWLDATIIVVVPPRHVFHTQLQTRSLAATATDHHWPGR